MITTNDIKTKDMKPEKLTIVQTGKTKPKEFNPKGKGKPRNKIIITTSNVKELQKKRKK